jgi:hypothetical protein
MSGIWVGIDTGGTFTDVVLIDRATGAYHYHKLPTTTGDPSRAILDGIAEVIKQAGGTRRNVEFIVLGTTLATNAVLEGKWAPLDSSRPKVFAMSWSWRASVVLITSISTSPSRCRPPLAIAVLKWRGESLGFVSEFVNDSHLFRDFFSAKQGRCGSLLGGVRKTYAREHGATGPEFLRSLPLRNCQ